MNAEQENNNTNLRALGEEHGYVVLQGTANGLIITSWSNSDDARVMEMFNGIAASDALTIDRTKFHATGFSQGGYMTWRLAQAHPDVWASIAPLAGSLSGAAPTTRIPTLYHQGKDDPLVSYSSALRTVEAVRSAWGLDEGEVIEESEAHLRRRHRSEDSGATLLEFIEPVLWLVFCGVFTQNVTPF